MPCVAVSPLIGGSAVKGPADRMLARLAGGTSPRPRRRSCYAGLIDALVVDEADADDLDGLGDGAAGRGADADGRRGRAAGARGGRARRGRSGAMRVAILGGTGSFGRALAARLVAAGEDEVVIGSRDAQRAAEAAGGARLRRARRTRTRCAAPISPCSPSRRTRRSRPPQEIADALGDDAGAVGRERAPVLEGRRPARSRRALGGRAGRRRRLGAGRGRACTRSLPPTSPKSRRRRTRSSAATTPRRRSSRSSSPAASSAVERSTPARSRARARSRG